MFTFGISTIDFLNENKKFILPSGNVIYCISILEEDADKIPDIFKNLKLNNNVILDVKKIELQNYNCCLSVKAFKDYHFETIEAIQYLITSTYFNTMKSCHSLA
jgi:hypothetical protein